MDALWQTGPAIESLTSPTIARSVIDGLHRQGRCPAGHEIRHDPAGAMRHGPADVPVPGIVEQVAVALASYDGQIRGRHRP